MGLDWCLKNKLREPGNADKVKRVEERIEEVEYDSDDHKKLMAELEKLVISPAEELKAPRVGIDPPATDYYHKKWQEAHDEISKATPDELKRMNPRYVAFWSRPLEECVKEEHGKYILEMVYDKSTCTGMMAGPTSFRGKCIGYSEWVDEDLQNEAYEDMTSEGMLDYAARLLQSTCDRLRNLHPAELGGKTNEEIKAGYATLVNMQQEIEKANPPHDDMFSANPAVELWTETLATHEKQIMEAWATFDAYEWLGFWGVRGFGLYAWS